LLCTNILSRQATDLDKVSHDFGIVPKGCNNNDNNNDSIKAQSLWQKHILNKNIDIFL
jgi:hypothetical protein